MAAKRSRVREKGDQLYVPVERIRIAVGKNERKWRRPFAALPHEVYADVVNLRSVVCKLVELLFRVAPVVSFPPVKAELAQVIGIHSAIPAQVWALGPAGVFQPLI